MAAWKFAPALAAGNSVVLKPAEQSPLSALRVAELAAEAGLPVGVFNVVPGFGETAGQALGRHMDVDSITFTGSTEVGKLFLKYAGDSNMKSVSLECGGKTPNIVFADTPNLDAAASGAADGIFYNSGRVRRLRGFSWRRKSVRSWMVTKLAAKYQPADPLDEKTSMGAMVNETQTSACSAISPKDNRKAPLLLGGRQVPGNKRLPSEATIAAA
jgi:acyl-CoA reductase-like NAD-dependent aldehyde dehydrogenase